MDMKKLLMYGILIGGGIYLIKRSGILSRLGAYRRELEKPSLGEGEKTKETKQEKVKLPEPRLGDRGLPSDRGAGLRRRF